MAPLPLPWKSAEFAPGARRIHRSWYYGVATTLGLVVVGGAATPPAVPKADAPDAPAPCAVAAQPIQSAPAGSPMDEPLRLLAESRQAYAGVTDYTCTMIKREKINNAWQPENVIAMRVRSQPFGVHLKWQEPRSLCGQEACFVEGRCNGKMRVKAAGLLGSVGFVSIDPNDARARQTSRHPITEAGLGNLLERTWKCWQAEKDLNVAEVAVADYEFNKRPCVRVQASYPSNPNNQFLYHRTVLYFDKATKLPVRIECYDWPSKPGEQPELLEVYSYLDMKLNVGLGDDVFNK